MVEFNTPEPENERTGWEPDEGVDVIFANDSTVGKGDMGIDAGMSIDGAVVGGMGEGTSAASSLGTASIAAAVCWEATGVASGNEGSTAATLGGLLTDVASGTGEDAGAGC